MNRIAEICPSDKNSSELAHERWNAVAKPLGSFGLLEIAVERTAAAQWCADVDISQKTVVVMCADNGVVEEGVTQCGSEVTAMSASAIASGTSNINALAKLYGAEVIAVDIGIAKKMNCPQLIDRKIAFGTKNIAKEPAMSRNDAEKAILSGIDIVSELKTKGTNIIVTGEMGIGNTTTASAVSSVILGVPPEVVTGRGAGLSSDGLERKINAVKRAISVNKPDPNDPLDIISKVGGFDIAGMTGVFLGGAIYHIPVVIDGVISAAAAVLAQKFNPYSVDYMLASHISEEPAGRGLIQKLGLNAIIDGQLRLGEGTGGILLLPLLEGALSLYYNSHKFEELGIERYAELT